MNRPLTRHTPDDCRLGFHQEGVADRWYDEDWVENVVWECNVCRTRRFAGTGKGAKAWRESMGVLT